MYLNTSGILTVHEVADVSILGQVVWVNERRFLRIVGRETHGAATSRMEQDGEDGEPLTMRRLRIEELVHLKTRSTGKSARVKWSHVRDIHVISVAHIRVHFVSFCRKHVDVGDKLQRDERILELRRLVTQLHVRCPLPEARTRLVT